MHEWTAECSCTCACRQGELLLKQDVQHDCAYVPDVSQAKIPRNAKGCCSRVSLHSHVLSNTSNTWCTQIIKREYYAKIAWT